ncbi:MAG TPA: hypothetical protein VGN90_14975 [Pyrinomonadaceae bacterium]|nr:hypothetical protein [Pyrinomonadaceae bacterium]
MRKTDLQTAVRNRYFYGKLLDVYHFELETNYLNAKRWLLNRLVFGYGVACGLDVKVGPEGHTIVISPGVAIDKWGREVVVPEETKPLAIPAELLPPPRPAGYEAKDMGAARDQAEPGKYDRNKDRQWEDEKKEEEIWIKVMLCYHECEGDPVPVMAGDCGGTDSCAAGTIREQYRITFQEGRSKPINTACAIPDLVPRERIDYPAVVRWVTDSCPEMPRNPCITLANILVSGGGHHCNEENIDINVRPIVYSNDLLYNLILSLLTEHKDRRDK